MPIQVTRMTEADIDGAIDTIQQAFADDPYNTWIYPDRSKVLSLPLPSSHHAPLTHSPQIDLTRNRVSLTLRCRWGISHGLFHVARASENPSKILGCAMWLPPHPTSELQSWSLYLSFWALWLNQIKMNLWYGRGGLSTRRYWIWKARQAEAQKELWTDDKGYYFCNIVTVLPEAQGRGVGRALMEEVLAQADREGVRCYLESSRKVPNVAIYTRFGFRLVREMACQDPETPGEDGRVMLYCMVRDPKMVGDGADGSKADAL
ncbi:acetyltransferas-like protein [Karstenula rhodostoma CBS 690.94]|uniref:Acetyltransferas-like protein n=1 Tax=Karstenula rhodostoma CBS 690.94 TaxID=1392251 RepID=A0A9P4P844_9PLEO|nr:acetyltransferas-like protein [Karstenula rhodostoma CBS 690.94]